MLANQDTVIVGRTVLLVPYRPDHVAVSYHFCVPELQELTASEPLTLEAEYDMQKKWRIDDDKLTFIVHARSDDLDVTRLSSSTVLSQPMIGDVNLFLKGTPEDDEFEVEVEIMIAENTYRRRGLARSALELLLTYATAISGHPPLPVRASKFVARIGDTNVPSIKLFEKLGFCITKRVQVFSEVELRLSSSDAPSKWEAGQVRQVVFN